MDALWGKVENDNEGSPDKDGHVYKETGEEE